MASDNADSAGPTLRPGAATGLLASLQRLLGSFTDILHTRLEILSIEAEEARWMVGQLIVYVLVAVLFLVLGLLLLTAFIIKASPEIYQLYVLAGFGVLYLLISLVFTRMLMHKLKTRSRPFSTTLFELDKDRHSLGGGS